MNRGAAFVADAVAVAASGENHVSGVENVGGVVVGNNGLAVEQVVELGVVGVVVFGNHAAMGQFDNSAHRGFAVGFVGIKQKLFCKFTFHVAGVLHVQEFHVFFFTYHKATILFIFSLLAILYNFGNVRTHFFPCIGYKHTGHSLSFGIIKISKT